MNSSLCFSIAGLGLFLIGLRALVLQPHLLRKVFGINLMGSGTFLLLVAPAPRGDPVTQAMVITGIVVAVSASALALNLMLKVTHASGRTTLEPGPPERAAPGRAAPGRAAPGRAAPGRDAPEQAAPGRAAPGRAAPGRDRSNPPQVD